MYMYMTSIYVMLRRCRMRGASRKLGIRKVKWCCEKRNLRNGVNLICEWKQMSDMQSLV